MNWGFTLEDYVEHLLRLGKNRESPEFKPLIDIFGLDRLIEMTDEIKAKWKQKKEENE